MSETATQLGLAARDSADMLFGFWYPAARAALVRRNQLTTALLLEIPLVLGRDRDGRPFAMRDACPHRGMPHVTNAFAVDSFIDEIAHAIKEDPLDTRLRLIGEPRLVPLSASARRRFGGIKPAAAAIAIPAADPSRRRRVIKGEADSLDDWFDGSLEIDITISGDLEVELIPQG